MQYYVHIVWGAMSNVQTLNNDGQEDESPRDQGPPHLRDKKLREREGARGRRISWLTVSAGLFSLFALFLMRDYPSFLACSVLAGAIAAILDYVVERIGITRRLWDYPGERMPIGQVPLSVPLLFFFCGIIATLIVFLLYQQQLVSLDHPAPTVQVGLVQAGLVILACYFIVQYAVGRVRSLTFWALPLSIALYLFFPEPMLLAIAVLTVYVDYYLEKSLVKRSNIRYEGYNDQTAINIALSYFATTLLLLEVVTALAVVL